MYKIFLFDKRSYPKSWSSGNIKIILYREDFFLMKIIC